MKKEIKENLGGRPPLYETPEALQAKIQQYFEDGMRFRTVIVGPPNNRQEITIKVPTISGLCIYCGFDSRQSFYDYEKKPGFAYTIKRARALIEREYEEQLQTGNPTGAIFALKNFDWRDTQDINHSIKEYLHDDLKDNDSATLRQRAREIADRIVADRTGTIIPSKN